MRDDAVLGRALPLDRGLGPTTLLTSRLLQQQEQSHGPARHLCIVSGLLDARLGQSCRYLDNEGRGLGTDTQ